MTLHVRVFDTAEELSHGVAAATAAVLAQAVEASGHAYLVLTGGSTPRASYRVLATEFGERVDWARVHVFWGDERYVPHSDPRSNYRMAKETLLDHVPCPAANVHPMPTHHAGPSAAAREYETLLQSFFDSGAPRFDLVHLGLGADGHIASLFPGSSAVDEKTRWTVPATAPDGSPRLTLTLPALTGAERIYFIVTGSGKAPAVRRALAGTEHSKELPATGVRLARGDVTWWLDRDAAAEHVRAGAAAAAAARQEE